LDAGETEIEEVASFAAADVIFRTLFSLPIENEVASRVFHEFRAYQRTQPVVNLAAFIPLPRWMPRPHKRRTRESAEAIRALIRELCAERMEAIRAGTAPDDLATKIMLTRDPVDGKRFSPDEMLDQVAIFFLAGHETSASALAWGLYLLANDPSAQDRVRQEVRAAGPLDMSSVRKLKFTRDVFRETLRLYPPVPMMVRETVKPERFRERALKTGSMFILSPWHIQRHERLWTAPDVFDPDRWEDGAQKDAQRDAYMPFSAGARVCTGAGFAMLEGVLLLAAIIDAYVVTAGDVAPAPTTQLTVRSETGINLRLSPA
ncbi:MAG: cytochrome P450, partial [Pseudomonadota bacterium]